jgi:dTDP-4-amino-4,6-dideoxygalactose transaminase
MSKKVKLQAGPGAYLIGEEEKKEVLEVLNAGNLFRYGDESDPTFKHKVVTFEKEFSEYIGVDYSIAVCNGTSALLTSLSALGIGPGDEVIVPGYTYISSISSIVFAKAIPVLAEIDESLTIDPADIEKKITSKTKAIMPVHMLGNPCDMDRIMKIAEKYNLFVIEDACQAAGGSYKGKKLGSIGDIGAFSLNFFKTITAGDGGVITTNNKDTYERAFAFADQGHKPFRMGIELGKRTMIGMNFRMTELTGAVALAQLRKINNIVETLRIKKKKLKNMIGDLEDVCFRRINDDGECATLLVFIFKTREMAKKFSEKIGSRLVYDSGWHVYNNMENILEKKMPTKINCPFECPFYGKKIEYKKHMLPRLDDILERSVMLSVGVVCGGLGADYGISIMSEDDEIMQVARKIKNIINEI